MAENDQIVAVGLLTRQDLHVLGTGFRRLYTLDDSTDFSELLRAIDLAEKRHNQQSEGDQD